MSGVNGLAGTVCICAEDIVAPLVGKPIWFGAIFKLTRSAHVAALAGAAKAIAVTVMPLIKAQCNVNRVIGCLSFVLVVRRSRLRATEAGDFAESPLPLSHGIVE